MIYILFPVVNLIPIFVWMQIGWATELRANVILNSEKIVMKKTRSFI